MAVVVFDAADRLSRRVLVDACASVVADVARGRDVASPSTFGHGAAADRSWEIGDGGDALDVWVAAHHVGVHLDGPHDLVAQFVSDLRRTLTDDVALSVLLDDSGDVTELPAALSREEAEALLSGDGPPSVTPST